MVSFDTNGFNWANEDRVSLTLCNSLLCVLRKKITAINYTWLSYDCYHLFLLIFFRNISRMWWRMRIRNKQLHWCFMNIFKYSSKNETLDVLAALVQLWRNHSRLLWMPVKFREVSCFESSVINFRYVIQFLSRSLLNCVTDFVYNKKKIIKSKTADKAADAIWW